MREREGGFIKIHRKILSSPVYLSLSAEQRSVFFTLLYLANWRDNPILVDGQWAVIKRGELFHSLKTIAKESNCGVQVVRTTIEKLSADDRAIGGNGPVITFRPLFAETSKTNTATNTGPRVITICNYGKYQDVPDSANTPTNTPPTRVQHAANTPPTPIEEGKEGEAAKEPTLPTAGAAAKEAAPKKPTNSRHASTIALWVRLWKEMRGGDYRVAGAKDASAVKRLLTYSEATDAEIELRARRALADQWFRSNGNLALFVSQWSKWEPPSALPLFAQAPVNDGWIEAEDDFYGRQAAEADARHAKEAAHGN